MGFFSVLKVGWKEPEAFRQEQDRLAAATLAKLWWPRPLCILVFTLIYILIWCGNKFLLHKKPIDLAFGCGIMLFGGWFMFYGIPWLLRRLPASVSLYSNGIMRMGEQNIHPFKGMSGFTWLQKDSYYILYFLTKKGRVLLYGVPDPMTRDKIEAILGQAGLSKISTLVKPDFEARRKAIWGQRVFTAAEVEEMREEENKA